MHQTDDDQITWMIVSFQILDQIYEVAKTGMSLRGVAKRFGVNPESLRRLVKRHAS
jgi:DNA-binding IclR family transcriptional regulator